MGVNGMSTLPESELRSRLIDKVERVELRVRELDKATAFYRDIAGLHVAGSEPERAWLGDGSGAPILLLDAHGVTEAADPDATGLFHTAIRFPTRASLGDVLARVGNAGLQLGAGDHLVSEALYVDDPDGNGVELYWDRPVEGWPPPNDTMAIPMATLPVDLESVMAEGSGAAAIGAGVPPGTDIGHVHLQVSELARTTSFYVDVLGLDQTASLAGNAGFFSSNGYHHHLGANIWRSRHGHPAGTRHAGLARVVFSVAAGDEFSTLGERAQKAGVRSAAPEAGTLTVWDPDGIELRFELATEAS
jgi:catechol 2,3-dioxygenase